MKKIVSVINENKLIIMLFIGILIIRIIYFISNQNAYIYPDSYGYMDFNFSKLAHLDFTNGRTPIYPLFLRTIKIIFGENNYLQYACYFQMIISFIAIFYFYKTLKLITERSWLLYGATFLFGASNTFSGYDSVILTESLALSGVVFFIYFIIKYLNSKKIKYGLTTVGLIFIMTFLRPSFLLLNLIVLAFLIVQIIITKRKVISKIIVFSLISWGLILIYCILFFNSMGIFTISDPMPRQLLIVCINRGYYLDSSDKEYVQLVNENVQTHKDDVWATVETVLPYFGYSRTQNYAKECIKNNLWQYIKDEISESTVNANYDFFAYNIAKENINKHLYDVRNLCIGFFDIFKPIHALILALVFLVITIKGLLREKRIYWLACGFSIFIISIFVSSMIATCGEYIRTMIHMFPFIYIGIVYLLELKISNTDIYTDSLKKVKLNKDKIS